MTEQEIKELVTKQRRYFQTGATLPVNARIAALRRLYAAITEHEKEINDALRKDLGKSGFESYMCETGMVLRTQLYDKAYKEVCRRKKSADAACTVSFQKLPETIALRRDADHESVELSFYADALSSGRCPGGWKYRCCETKRLFSLHQ